MAKKEKNSIFSLKDRVVIVTGAAGLLGKNHVEAIASFEGTPILLDINKERNVNIIIDFLIFIIYKKSLYKRGFFYLNSIDYNIILEQHF